LTLVGVVIFVVVGVVATKFAVTLRLAVTLPSVRVALVTPSDQLTKRYPLVATALIAVPDAPETTVCAALPEIVPPRPAL
jgi:hypothetical protein